MTPTGVIIRLEIQQAGQHPNSDNYTVWVQPSEGLVVNLVLTAATAGWSCATLTKPVYTVC